MSTVGSIKTKIERASVGLYGKPEFKTFMREFKAIVLENKDFAELFYIYDDLNTKKGLSSDIADDYINESIEYAQILIEGNRNLINFANRWISNIVKNNKNSYGNIDTLIYENSIKNLETVLESKKQVKKIITESKDDDVIIESLNLPLSSVMKIANSTLNNHLSSLNESEKQEIKSLLSTNQTELKKEMNLLKKNVITKLQKNLNESTDSELKHKLGQTIEKIRESKNDHYNLYKLRQLNIGL